MTDRLRAGVFLVVFALVSGSTLALIDAPPAVAYQHFRLPESAPAAWMVGFALLASVVLLATMGRGTVATVWRWARRQLGTKHMAILLGVVAVASAAPSREPTRFATETMLGASLTVLAALTLAVALHAFPRGLAIRLVDAFLGSPEAGEPAPRERWIWVVAAAVVLVATLLNLLAYERHPHVPDEVAYLLHARYLAAGMLTMPLPPVPAGFAVDLMQYEPTRWYSPVPPGWPAVLAIGARLGVPWLVNPVLGGVATVLGYRLLRRMYDRRTARLATLLLASSPWMLFLSMSYMTHQVTLVLALLAALGVARARERGSSWSALAGGLATGAVSLVRPLEGLAVAMLMGVWSLAARGRRFRFAPSAALVAGSILAGALVMPYNALLTGSPRTFPIMAYTDAHFAPGANAMGFGANRGLGWSGLDPFPGHGVRDVVANALLNASQVNVELLGWPIGAVLVVGLLFSLRAVERTRADWWNVAAIVVVVGVHSFYWFSGGPDFGARYWYLIVFPCAALAARAVMAVGGSASSADGDATFTRARPLAAAVLLAGFALFVYVPWRAAGKYHHYRGMRADIRTLANVHRFGESLVLVRGRRFPDYASAAVYNPLDLRSPVPVFAWDATPAIRSRLLEEYADRDVWIVDGPSLSGRGYEVVAGPMTAEAARRSPVLPDAAGHEAGATDPTLRSAPASRP